LEKKRAFSQTTTLPTKLANCKTTRNTYALADTTRTENDNFVVWHYEVCRRPRRTSKERNERCVEERESAREGGLRIQERERRRRAEVEKGAGKQTTKHKQ
jgi:hypothetical protein